MDQQRAVAGDAGPVGADGAEATATIARRGDRRGLPTIEDVAFLAGVSKATASRALSNSRDRVSSALADRVRQAAAELDYVPNRTARALARSESDAIGLIVHDVSDPYFGEIARGVLAGAGAEDRLVVICNTYRDAAAEARYVAELRAQRVAAVVLAGSAYADDDAAEALRVELRRTRATGARVVVLAPHGVGRAVLPDNRGGGSLAAAHLAELGHRHVAIAAGPPHLATIQNRLAGFRQTWLDARLPDPAVTFTTFDRAGGAAAVQELLDRDTTQISAVFALNDLMAIGAMRALGDAGMRTGVDVSVVGFDDIPLAGDVTPGLTTIRVPMEELGRRAVAVLAEPDVGEVDAEPEVLACELVLRGTTAPPARRS